jgi:hypothetical protein
MEAKLVRYETEQITNVVGQIAVTATKEEWQEVIQVLTFGPRSTGTESLVHWLINQGVYE